MSQRHSVLGTVILTVFLFISPNLYAGDELFIRINRLGYTPGEIKKAVCYIKNGSVPEKFYLCSALTGDTLSYNITTQMLPDLAPFNKILLLTLPENLAAGSYTITASGVYSPAFRVANNVYTGSADYLLNYLRQQQCGYNPALKDSCHTKDGFVIYHPTLDSTHIDVTGGWHDASDYLRYVTTSATTVYQLALAYQQAPEVFKDEYSASGDAGKNGIPDVLDQVKWGINWLLKMNPNDSLYFHQIADDRDHRGFRLPNEDTITYGSKPGRPVYTVTGEIQGVYSNKNRTTGKASTLAKFASSFAIAASVLKPFYPELTEALTKKAVVAFDNAAASPGVQQTAPCRSPYFYEEDSYTDDMLLAATELALLTKDNSYTQKALRYLRTEPVTGWMGKDTASHYQYYPFVNAAAFRLANSYLAKREGLEYMANCLDTVISRGKRSPAGMGVPFIWCSNNLLSSWLSLFRFYTTIRDRDAGWDFKLNDYREYEPFYRNWLFGMNPWGSSMVTGLPLYADYPEETHSAYAHYTGKLLKGALVDGPVYGSIYSSLKGVYLKHGDEYSAVQPNRFVYHDDPADYSTNEPTLDGTASLVLYLAQTEKKYTVNRSLISHGGIIRGDTTAKKVYLVFTGHEYGDGLDTILSTLIKNNTPAGFFFTGDFYRNVQFANSVKRGVEAGYYFGAHSDKHLLYAPWEKRDSLLLTEKEFAADLTANYMAMKQAGVTTVHSRYFLPPYEWYNDSISIWAARLGLDLINFTPGTGTNADYTIPSMNSGYRSSEQLMINLKNYEKKSANGLNGVILLLHAGTASERTDKFYVHLQELIDFVSEQGYSFGSLYELTSDKNPITKQTGKPH